MEVATREEMLTNREDELFRAEHSLAEREREAEVLLQKRVEAVRLEYRGKLDLQEKRAQERLRRAEELKDRRIREVEELLG